MGQDRHDGAVRGPRETYGWLGEFPKMCEWLGWERVVRDIEARSHVIVNRTYDASRSTGRAMRMSS